MTTSTLIYFYSSFIVIAFALLGAEIAELRSKIKFHKSDLRHLRNSHCEQTQRLSVTIKNRNDLQERLNKINQELALILNRTEIDNNDQD